jgi:hypothetical protein
MGDAPYGTSEAVRSSYQGLIERINGIRPAFSIHIGDIKSGSTECSDALLLEQLANFRRFAGAVVYTPGDNEWTDCHRANNGSFNPLERLSFLRKHFYTAGRSLGGQAIAVENQALSMPQHASYIENQRWTHAGVLFATLHIVGSNNNLESRNAQAAQEFFERDAANVAWIQAAFAQAQQQQARALVLAFQADVFDSKTAADDFPGWSGFKRSIEQTLLPLARAWGKPVLVVHGDSHQFRIDQPFNLDKKPLRNVTRLIVPGQADIRAVRVQVSPDASFAFELFGPAAP